jgi:hypothetical protein
MEALYLFIVLLLGLTIGFGIILGQSSRVDTMEHWGERRCDFDVLMASFYYKPESDTRTSFEFSADNFNFCISSMSTNYLNTLFAPLFEALRKQMGVADIMTEVMKTMRTQLNSIFAPFSKMMAKLWNKFKQIGALGSRIFQHLFMAMKKAAATSIASVFVALSLQTGLMNSIDLAINVIMIVLYILIALAFIFFLPILPLLAFVITTVGGIESAMPGRTGTMGAIFGCFAEDTQISMKDTSVKNICDIQLGDILANGQIVESVIELPGSNQLYVIDGIYVTGDHRIWDSEKKQWVFVKDYSGSTLSTRKTTSIWTLITSDRTIPIKGTSTVLLFADWEELPDTEESALLWESIVRDILESQTTVLKAPDNAPCFHPSVMVKIHRKGWIPISSVKRGDWILDDLIWTKVIGVCKRRVSGGIGSESSRTTSGTWIWKRRSWEHPNELDDTVPWSGVHLLTKSGTFSVLLGVSDYCIVRDFTEVGFSRLPETYTRVEMAMTPPSDV